jgi:hypothetical protein
LTMCLTIVTQAVNIPVDEVIVLFSDCVKLKPSAHPLIQKLEATIPANEREKGGVYHGNFIVEKKGEVEYPLRSKEREREKADRGEADVIAEKLSELECLIRAKQWSRTIGIDDCLGNDIAEKRRQLETSIRAKERERGKADIGKANVIAEERRDSELETSIDAKERVEEQGEVKLVYDRSSWDRIFHMLRGNKASREDFMLRVS